MSISEILDGGFTLFKANARTMLLLAATFLVPIQLIAGYFRRDLLGGVGLGELLAEPSLSGLSIVSGPGSAVALLISVASSALVLPVMAGAISRVASSSYLGAPLTYRQALRGASRRWLAFVAAWILAHAVVAVAGFALFFPALAAMALCAAVVPAMATEGIGARAAVGRSIRLTWPRLFPALVVVLVTAALSSALTFAIGVVPQIGALFIGYGKGWVLAAAGSTVTALITQPVVVCIATLLYIDGRIRSEGLDVAIMADDLAASAPLAAVAAETAP